MKYDLSKELQQQKNNVSVYSVIDHRLPNVFICSDICSRDWGAAFNLYSTFGHCDLEESKKQTKVMEMKIVYFAIKIHC